MHRVQAIPYAAFAAVAGIGMGGGRHEDALQGPLYRDSRKMPDPAYRHPVYGFISCACLPQIFMHRFGRGQLPVA